MGQRIKEYPGAPEDWLKDIRQRMGRAGSAVTGLEGEAGFGAMQAAMYERGQLEQYRRVFRATGQAPGGGLFLPGEEFAAEEAAAPRGPRVGRGRRVLTAAEEFYNQLSFGGAYFKLMAAQRIFGRPVDQWEQAASGYTSSQLGFAVEMGAGADVISGSPIGSIAAGQATARTFQMGMGEAGLMSQAGLANIVGRTIGDGSVYGAGRTLGAIATPLMRGAQTGLTAGVLAGAAGKLAPMLGAEFDAAGALVGGTRLGGLAAGLGAASGTIGLVAGGLTALGVAGAYTYQQGEAQNVYRNLIERQGRGLQGPGLIQQAGMAIHSLNPFDYGYEKSVMQGWEELQGSTQLKIAEATVYLEDVDIAGLDPQQKMQLGSFLALGGVTEEEIKSGGARSLLEKMAPMAIAGTLEGATQRTTQLSGALGIAPGAGLRPYWDYMSGLAPTEQQQTVMAGGILGGLGAQIGRTPMLDEIRRYQQALAEGVPEWQLSLQAQTEYGMLPGAQIGGVRAGTSAAQALSGVLAPTSQAQATNQAEIGRGLRQYWDVLGYTEGQMAQQTKESERLVGTGVVSMEQEQRYWQAQSGMLGLAQYYGYGAGTEQAQAFEGQYGNITAQGLARQRTIAQYSGAVGQYRGGNWDYMFGSMVDQGLPSQTLSLIQNQLMGQGAVGQALGGLPGFNNETSLMNMLMNQQLTPQDYGRMAGLAQFGMSQQGYNMMAGGYGLGGPLAQMFGMLEERGMGPGAPTGPALMDAQGYGYGTFERRGINWAQYGLQQRQQEASWEYQQTQNAFQMGDWGGTSSVGWGFGLTGQIQIQQDLMEFTKQIRAITHEMIALQREQSMRGIEYQERGLEMSTRHSLENLGMSRRMWQENTQFSRLQMGVQWGQMETQQGWQMQDMAWNRQMAGFQYEYQQDELERSIRLATGREKQGLLRRREYQEEMYARQEDRRGVEEERAKQVMEWERQKFSLQKEHFERVTQLQEMQFNMQERHILERYALDKEKIEQQKQDMQAIWALEDERRKLQEAWEDRQQQYHLEELERQKRYYEEVVFPYQKQQHDFQLESMKYQEQSMKLQEDIEDAHAKYQAWQIQQYSPGGELYDKVMEFINEIIAAVGGAQIESGDGVGGTYPDPDPDDPQIKKKTKGTASGGGLAEALFAGLQGASMKLVLDDGKSFDAHIETV
ncbi:MAG: hypothetical protein M0R06_22760, partial [Sphaerochaeta sp.]|nr:hypothetical protein [Sphaerochaeta sp.]